MGDLHRGCLGTFQFKGEQVRSAAVHVRRVPVWHSLFCSGRAELGMGERAVLHVEVGQGYRR